MKARILRFGSIFVFALLALAFFGPLSGSVAPVEAATPQKVLEPAAPATAPIMAIFRISVPFSIDDIQHLHTDGRQITATGPGECPVGGESFRLMVRVRQGSTHALGHTAANCTGAGQTWQATAVAVGKSHFVEGPAEVCSNVLVRLDRGAVTKHWCKAVTLTQ
jgi:hypothetical protein